MPDFDRQTFEEDTLKSELGIVGAAEGDETPSEEPAATAPTKEDQPIDTSKLTDEDHQALEDSDPGPTEDLSTTTRGGEEY